MAGQNDGKTEKAEVEVLQPEPAPGPEGTLVLARHTFPERIPILPLHNRPAFPRMTFPLFVEAENLQQALEI